MINNRVINNYLNKYITQSNEYTHISMTGGKYNIPKDEISDFYKLLAKEIDNGYTFNFLEKRPKDYCKLTIDLDIKYNIKPNKREINEEFLLKMGRRINSVIKNLLSNEPEYNENILDCYLLQRPTMYKVGDIIKDGIHIQYPNLIISREIQEIILNKIIENDKIKELLNTLSASDKNDIIDKKASIYNAWFIYGCSKPDIPAYKLINKDLTDTLEIIRNLSFYYGKKIDFSGLNTYIKPKYNMSKSSLVNSGKTTEINNEYIDDKALEKYDKLLSIINPKRWDNYNDWFNIGAGLYNTSPELFDIYKKYSKTSEKYTKGCCEKNWEQYSKFIETEEKKPITISTIQHYAKLDNEKEFIKWEIDYYNYDNILKMISDNSHTDFARVLYKYYSDKYMYFCDKWYEYKQEKHRWFQIKESFNIILKKKLSNILENIENYYLNNNTVNIDEEDDENDELDGNKNKKDYVKKMLNKGNKIIKKSISNLKNTTFKTSVINEAKELFYTEDIEEKMDSNNYLIGFNNGVIDLENLEFRDGKPDDYITYSTHYDFATEDDPDTQKELFDIIDDIIPNANERDFVLTVLASTLEGCNTNEIFMCLEGSGGNGKSILTDLHASSIGDYADVLNNNYITNTFNSPEHHNTMLYNIYKKRFVQVNEPSNKKELNLNIIKELTGGDKIQLRPAHSAVTYTVQPKFKLVCLFNKTPKIEDTNDGGFLRRFVGVKFPNRFVDNPKKPNEKKKDANLKEKVKKNIRFHQQWIRILLKYYKKYIKNNRILIIPDTIKKNSKNLVNEQDPVSDFIDAKVNITENIKIHVSLQDLYREYKLFCSDNYQGKLLTKKELLTRLKEHWDKEFDEEKIIYKEEYKGIKNVFKGVEIKIQDIEMSDIESD